MAASPPCVPWTLACGFDYLARSWLTGPFLIDDSARTTWIAELAKLDADLARRASALLRIIEQPTELDAANSEFQACVKIPVPGRYVPPYASVHIDEPSSLWGPTTDRMMSLYAAHGLEWMGQTPRYPWVRAPDHLGVECAFAGEMWATAYEEQPVEKDTARPLIAEHLLRWVPRYCAELAETTSCSYWESMTGFLEAFVLTNASITQVLGSFI